MIWLVSALVVVAACLSESTGPSAGPPSPGQSEVRVSVPILQAGETAIFTVVTNDADGRRVPGGGHAVVFGTNGGTSQGVLGAVQDAGDGTYSASFAAVEAGTPATVTASIDGDPVTTPLPTVQVVAGALSLAGSIIDVAPRTVTPGGQAILTLETRDAAGNRLGEGGHVVAFLPSGGTATGSMGPVTDHGDGRYTTSFTGTAVGTPLTIGGSIDGMAVTSVLPTLSVSQGVSADSSTLTVSSDTVSIDRSVTLVLQVRDSGGVARTSGGETVVFAVQAGTGAGGGVIDSTTDQDDGTYTATFTATQPGPVVIGATLNGRAITGSLPTVTVLAATPAVPQKSSVTVSTDTVAAGATALLTLTIRDLDSNQTSAGAGLAVTFTAGVGNTSQGAIGPVTDHGDGTYSAVFTGTTTGPPATIGAMLEDSSQVEMLDSLGVSHLPTITVIPGQVAPDSSLFTAAPTRVDVGDSALVRLETRDGYGNRLEAGGLVVTFQRAGGPGVSVGHLRPVTDAGDGSYLAAYIADTAGVPDTVLATIGTTAVIAAMPVIQVTCTPGAASTQQSTLTVNDTTAAKAPTNAVSLPSGVSTTVTLTVRDSRGCPITASHVVAFTVSGGTGTGTLGPTVDQGDGSYTATFTGVLAGAALAAQATIDGAPVTSPSPAITVIPGDISAQTSLIGMVPQAIDSGAHSVATLQARDAAGNALTTGGRGVTFSFAGPGSHGTLGPTTDLGNGTYTSVYTATTVAPGVPDAVTAAIEGTPVQTPPGQVEVVAGTISPDQSDITVGGSAVAAGDSVLVILTGRDASGRLLVTGDRPTAIVFTQAGSGTGVFGPAANHDDGTYSAWFQGRTAGTATIGALIGGQPVTTPLPSVTVSAGPASTATSTLSAAATSVPVGGTTTVELQVFDAYGNPVNDPGLSIIFSVAPGSVGSVGVAAYVNTNRWSATFTAVGSGTASLAATINGVSLATPAPDIVVP